MFEQDLSETSMLPPDGFVGRELQGQYRIVKRIGHGAYGSVYGAKNIITGESVAIKRLHDYSDKTVVDRFMQEAEAYRQLSHPNIVKMLDLIDDDGQICIVMEFVRGRTLERYIQKGTVFTPEQIVVIARQIASALSCAHESHIIHRDLKTENIMLVKENDGSYTVKLLDFGLAKLLRRANICNTNPGVILGSPAYMSPEQCRGAAPDQSLDIYALGIVLYYMICGHLPFEAADSHKLMHCQCSSPIPPMERPDHSAIPPFIKNITLRCLEKNPKDRFADCDQIYAAFANPAIQNPRQFATIAALIAIIIALIAILFCLFI